MKKAIARRFEFLRPALDERTRRLILGAEAMAIGRGVCRATGVVRETVADGVAELERGLEGDELKSTRIRNLVVVAKAL